MLRVFPLSLLRSSGLLHVFPPCCLDLPACCASSSLLLRSSGLLLVFAPYCSVPKKGTKELGLGWTIFHNSRMVGVGKNDLSGDSPRKINSQRIKTAIFYFNGFLLTLVMLQMLHSIFIGLILFGELLGLVIGEAIVRILGKLGMCWRQG